MNRVGAEQIYEQNVLMVEKVNQTDKNTASELGCSDPVWLTVMWGKSALRSETCEHRVLGGCACLALPGLGTGTRIEIARLALVSSGAGGRPRREGSRG